MSRSPVILRDAVPSDAPVFRRRAAPTPMRPWCAARAVVDLADALADELAERGGSGLLAHVERPLVGVLAQIDRVGIAVNDEVLAELEDEFAEQIRAAAGAAYAVLGREIPPTA